MSWTRLLARFRPEAPEVPVTPALRTALEARLTPIDPEGDPGACAGALSGALDELVLPLADDYRSVVALPRAEIAAELALLAAAGFAWELGGRLPEERAAALASALVQASVEYVGFDYRGRYSEGPAPLIHTMTRIGLEDREPWSVAAGITGQRLRVGRWRGGSEGWFRLALLAWVAGEELAQAPAQSG